MSVFDFRESTISFDYERRLVEFYFTRQSNYNACLKRNPNYILAENLNPGFRILYPFNQVRTPEYLLRTPNNSGNTGRFGATTPVEEVV
jgi:hypothetical protein